MDAVGVRIGDRTIGSGEQVFFIAEAGVAHFGDMERARELIDLAAEAGADAVKFQIYDTSRLIASGEAEWRQRLGSKELPYHAFLELQRHAAERGITFLVTPHEEDALDYLVDVLRVLALKVGSGEVGNLSFLRRVADKQLPTLVSLGLHQEREIEQVTQTFQEAGNSQLVLMHCVTRYPTPPSEANLRSISWLQRRYPYPVGYSDHAAGHAIALAAVALGACVIEKHFFLDRTATESQDAHGACDASDLSAFVRAIRDVECALGVEGPNPNTERLANLAWARKSVVAAAPLRKGHQIAPSDLVLKRPGRGLAPEFLPTLFGRRLARDVAADHVLEWADLEGDDGEA